MVAVIDDHVERRVMVGPAAASGYAGPLVHDHTAPAPRQPHGGGKPGEPRADDVNRPRHQMKAYRMMIHNSRVRGRRIGRRGGDQPRATRLSRISLYASLMIRGARTQRRGLRAMIMSACTKCPRTRSTMVAHTFPSIGLASTAAGSVVLMPAARKACAGR